MLTCETCQPLLLEYLYDVLDPTERQAIDAHLAGCQACTGALDRARGQQKLLAAAARLEFPQVRFEAPAAPAGVLPLAASRHTRRVRVLRWAVAAAVLLAVVGLPGLKFARDYQAAAQLVAENKQRVAQGREAMQQAANKVRELPRQADEKFAALQKSARERQVKMDVVGPATVQPGAPAEFQVQLRNLAGQSASAKVVAEILDRGQRVGEPIVVPSIGNGAHRLTLPPDLPVRPDSQLNLVVSARLEGGSRAEVHEQLQLAHPVYLTHITTDKPMYQPGEVVRFRSLTLNRASLKPAEEEFRLVYTIVPPVGGPRVILQGTNLLVRGNLAAANNAQNQPPNNAQPAPPVLAEVLGPDKKPIRGVGAGEFALEGDAPGGEYTLTVREEHNRFPEQQRKFIVNRYQKPRLNKELDFSRKTYGPGDEVLATCKANRADGGPVANRKVDAVVQIDGQTYDAAGAPSAKPLSFTTDNKGTVLVRFKLPAVIDKGLASLSVTFDDGGNVESLVRPLPIVLKKLQVEFFPEGGDLVAGLNNRVYFQVKTTLGKPADLKGRLLEDGKPLPVEVQTLSDDKEPGVNQGMGRFAWTPRAKAKYELQIDSPIGITERYALPAVREDGVVLSTPVGVYKAGEEIKFSVRGSRERALMVGLYCRGRLLDSVRLPKGQTDATLKPAAGMGGVCRVTAFEELPTGGLHRDLKPVAERLVYCQPAERLNLAIHADRKTYVPGQRASVTIESVNEKDEKAPAIVMVAVVDKSVVTLADDKTARSMPTHFLLTTEVRKPEDLEYADFLLTSHPKAAETLDLLLGTQGWRRFAEQDPGKFRQLHREEADRLLVTIGQPSMQKADFIKEELAAVREETKAQVAQSEKDYKEAEAQVQQALDAADYKAATTTLAGFRSFFDKLRRVGKPAGAVLLVLVTLVFLVRALRKSLGGALLSYAGAAACAALLAVVSWSYLQDQGSLAPEAAIDRFAMVTGKQIGATKAPGGMGAENADVGRDLDDPGAAIQQGGAVFGAMKKAELKADKDFAAGEPRAGAANAPPAAERALPIPAPNEVRMAPGGARMARQAARAMPVAPAPAAAMQVHPLAEGAKVKQDMDQAKAMPQIQVQNQAVLAAKGQNMQQAVQKREQQLMADRPADGKVALQDRMDQLGDVKNLAERAAVAGRRGVLLRQRGQAMGGMAMKAHQARDAEFLEKEALPPLPPLVVREFAHQVPAGTKSEQRADFAETLFWHPVLVLDGGKADFSFDLCDSVTTFQVTAFAHTLDGRLGATTHLLDSRLPLTIQPKVPIEVTASDRIDIPVSIANNTDMKRQVDISLRSVENLGLVGTNPSDRFEVPAASALRRIYRFKPSVKEGSAVLSVEAKTESFPADVVRNTFRVVPEGFPITVAQSDVLEKSASQALTLPANWVPGTLKCSVNVFPSTLADLQKGLEGLLREPGGCFEQTSTSNYPNLLVLDYLRESDQARPELEKRARDMLARGYRQLVSFECPSTPKKVREGFEWFGSRDQGHEALTAYGLLQFRDLARVQEVDPALIQRTRAFLMEQRDGKGGFKRNPRALDTFGRAPEDITNAYIVWAITESGKEDNVTPELTALAEKAKTSTDPYFLALVANSLINRDKSADGVALLKKVAQAQKPDGHLDAATTSITGSGGRDLQIETTAFAVLGWLKANNPAEFNQVVQKAVKWIAAQRGGYGGFGSTQSTILALKSLIAFTKANKKTPEAGTLKLFVDGKLMGEQAFPAGASEALTLDVPDAEKHLQPGKNNVRVDITGKNVFPYTLAWSYHSLQPLSADNCPVRLEAKLPRDHAAEGEVVRVNVKVENATDKGQGMAVAILGLPGGMNLPEDLKQLKEYIRLPEDGTRPLVGAFEIRGRELVLYWRDLAPRQKIEVPIDLICRVPGEYTGPASRAYLYYNADTKHWIEPLKMTVDAKAD